MRQTVFIRVHEAAPDEKGLLLCERTAKARGGIPEKQIFRFGASDLTFLPGSPFAYWVSDAVRGIFRSFPAIEGNGATVRVGLQTSDDFRFVRTWWEVQPQYIGYSGADTEIGMGWVHFAKGGSYRRYYADLTLLLRWHQAGAELKAFATTVGAGHWSRNIRSPDFYFRPGFTWSERTAWFSLVPLPEGSVFSVSGKGLFPSASSSLVQAVLGSAPANYLLRLYMARIGLDPKYQSGDIQRIPFPSAEPDVAREVEEIQASCVAVEQELTGTDEVLHAYSLPELLVLKTSGLLEEADSKWGLHLADTKTKIQARQQRIDRLVFELYRISLQERDGILEDLVAATPSSTPIARTPSEGLDSASDQVEDDAGPTLENPYTRVANLLMWCVGVAFGRWDARMARDRSLIPALQGPFERLPRVAPGGLVGPDGLPATEQRIASEAWLRARPNVITLPEPDSFEGPDAISAAEYPVEVAWDGILVDDEGHPRDIVARVRQVLVYVYGDRAGAIEDEALQILRGDDKTPRTLRDWLRAQKAAALGKNFHDFHIQRYSKSRRKAPLYWRLTGDPRGGGRYAVWTYFHRLTGDSLYRLLAEYLGPRVRLEEARQAELRRTREGRSGRELREIETALEESAELLEELSALERGVRAAAERGWRPEPDDGIVLNLAPLHGLTPWKEPEAAWKKLEKGEYDWARAAMRYWPERVREKCATDRSLAIAHGLDQEPRDGA